MFPGITQAQDVMIAWAPAVLGALAILILGWIVAKLVRLGAQRGLQRTKVDPILITFVANLVYAAVLVFVIIAAVSKLGVNTTSFAAVVAAAGLAIGLALQDSLGNFAAGFMIIVLRPFRSEDFIEAGGVTGTVESISVFATTLRTGDNKEIIVPNGQIVKNTITNYSKRARRRIDLVIGVGYDDDLRLAKQVLINIVEADERVLADPAPVVAVSELGDSSVNFIVRPWVVTADYWTVRWDLTEAIKLELDARGISIPYPQRDVHLHAVPAAVPVPVEDQGEQGRSA